jgi:hypothetical protein
MCEILASIASTKKQREGREEERERGKEGGRERGREGGREKGRKERKEGREGGREGRRRQGNMGASWSYLAPPKVLPLQDCGIEMRFPP